MASGSGPKRHPAQGSIASAAGLSSADPRYTHIEEIIHSGGQIMIGTVNPIKHAAVAHDGKKTIVMLRCKASESLANIVMRLEAAIATAKRTGERVDEVNRPGSDTSYEF